MALSLTERATVRRALGVADITQGLYSVLEGSFDAISTEAEAEVRQLTVDFLNIESILRSSWSRLKVLKVEDVTLANDREVLALRAEGNRLAQHMATILGVTVQKIPFQSGRRGGAMALG